MTDEDLIFDSTPVEQEDVDLLAGSIARFGPTEREQAMCRDLYRDHKSERDEAWRYCIAPRTMRNMARATRNRIAAEMAEWDLLSLAELHEERRRVVLLRQHALRAFEDSQQDEPRLRHRGGACRYLEIAVRLGSLKRRMAAEIRARTRREAAQPARTVPAELPVGGGPAGGGRESFSSECKEESKHAGEKDSRPLRRRKILRGRRLRLPRFDRNLLIVRPAVARWIGIRRSCERKWGRWCTGIPPPRALEGPSCVT
jgi:hypothetical protein